MTILKHLRGIVADLASREPIRLAYLFGSHAGGMPDGESDIDIAFFIDPSLSREDRLQLRLRCARVIAEELHVPLEKIDLIILQDVPVLLQMNVIRRGERLYETDRSERVLQELHIEQMYDDESYYLERESQMILDRILSRSA